MARPRKDTPGLDARRAQAIRLVEQDGLSCREAARRVGCNPSSVQRWVTAGRRRPQPSGSRKGPGRPTRLTAAAKALLRERLLNPPRARHIQADGWTTELVVQQLRSLTQRDYTSATTEKILRGLGFTRARRRRGPVDGPAAAYWSPRIRGARAGQG